MIAAALPTDRLRHAAHPAVLVTSGAFSPVHRNHLLLLEAARAFLEAPSPPPHATRGPPDAGLRVPLQVVGGYISALPDRMVARRRGGHAIPRAHRTAMLQLAVADVPGLMVVDAELHGVALFQAVAQQTAAALGTPVTVVAVCGEDGYRASDGFLPPHIPLACVRRTGHDDAWKRLWKSAAPERRRLYLIADNHQPVARSATQIRGLLQRALVDGAAHDRLRDHLHPDVLRYLLERPELYAS